jgi:hypothetical protein
MWSTSTHDPHPVALCEGTPTWLLLQCAINAVTVQARLLNSPAARRPAEQLAVLQLGRQRRLHLLLLLLQLHYANTEAASAVGAAAAAPAAAAGAAAQSRLVCSWLPDLSTAEALLSFGITALSLQPMSVHA